MLLELIEKNFYEAQKSIADFISDKSNFVAIENAALKMFEAL